MSSTSLRLGKVNTDSYNFIKNSPFYSVIVLNGSEATEARRKIYGPCCICTRDIKNLMLDILLSCDSSFDIFLFEFNYAELYVHTFLYFFSRVSLRDASTVHEFSLSHLLQICMKSQRRYKRLHALGH